MDKPKLSFITTCMGRLEHLKQTLPTQQHPDCESIVVDWSCPDGTAAWVRENHPWVQVVSVEGHRFYHRSKSRNVGRHIARGEYICNADADMSFDPKFFDILDTLSPTQYVVRIPTHVFVDRKIGTSRLARMEGHDSIEPNISWISDGEQQEEKASHTGFTIFPNRLDVVYDKTFDQRMSGGEDLDIRLTMLMKHGLIEREIGTGLIDTISHTDEMRGQHLDTDHFQDAFKTQIRALMIKWGNRARWNPAIAEKLREMYK